MIPKPEGTRQDSQTIFPVDNYGISDIFCSLTVLCSLPQLTKEAEANPNGPEKRLISHCMRCVRWNFHLSTGCVPLVEALNEYERLLNDSGNTERTSKSISELAHKYREPLVERSLPWFIVLFLIIIGGLCVAAIALVAASPKCCTPTMSVAIALSASAVAFVIALFPLVYCTQRTRTERSLDRITAELVGTLARHQVGPQETKNPLTASPTDTESKTKAFSDEFLIDWEAAMRRKKAAGSVLTEATEETGNVVLLARGFPASRVSLNAINKHTIIIMTDLDGKIVLWSEGAVVNCGFSARDAEGNNINSLLYGEKSVQLYATMAEAAEKNLEISEKILTLAHLTLGTISVSANVVLARDTEANGAVGYALIGSVHSDELSRMQSLFHNFFVAELSQLHIKDPQFRQIVGCLRWKDLRDLSALARDWGSASIRRLLSEVIKSRQNQVDVDVDSHIHDISQVLCDTLAVSAVLTKSLDLFPGKIRVRVELKRTTEAVYQLVVSFQHDTSQINRELLLGIAQSANDVGGLVVESPGTLKVQLPFMIRDDVVQAFRPQGMVVDKGTGHEPLIILLLEKNAVYRHNISTTVWSCGHSLRLVENVKDALKAIEASTDLQCAIIDADIKGTDQIIDALLAKKIYTIETSESPNNAAQHGEAMLKKPINVTALRKELNKATSKNEEARKADETRLKRREVFGKVRNSPWVRGRFLGKGAFATVYEATSTLTGGKMAVKIINVENFEDRIDDLMNEIEILCKMNHPNIIHYFYCERTESTLNLFMALADQGTVEDLLRKCPRLPENHLATIIKQLLQAVNYLHEHGVIHRDIKPGNMLISQGQLRLSDFGTATTTVREGMVGTPYYMAPEVIDGKESGRESDIWSIGCVVCKCLQIDRPGGVLGFDAPEKYPDYVSAEVIDFIKACMKQDPTERATAGTLLLHDFIVHLDHEVSQLAEPPLAAMTKKEEEALSLGASEESSKLTWSI